MTDQQFYDAFDVLTFWVFAALTGAIAGLFAGVLT